MILVDSSVWVDHLRHAHAGLVHLLERGAVLMHPFVVGEIACGSLADRSVVLDLLQQLPMAEVADSDEVLGFIERRGLHGRGIGLIDVHLLASTALTAGARLWTHDRRLRTAAAALACDYQPAGAH